MHDGEGGCFIKGLGANVHVVESCPSRYTSTRFSPSLLSGSPEGCHASPGRPFYLIAASKRVRVGDLLRPGSTNTYLEYIHMYAGAGTHPHLSPPLFGGHLYVHAPPGEAWAESTFGEPALRLLSGV